MGSLNKFHVLRSFFAFYYLCICFVLREFPELLSLFYYAYTTSLIHTLRIEPPLHDLFELFSNFRF
jgi:hypothetical protein